MDEPPVRRFPARDGHTLAYREVGAGRPIVLLHGFVTGGAPWLRHGPVTDLVAHGFRVVLPDLRGHGESARPHDPRAYPPDVLADDGFALLDHLGLGDHDLAGYSLGARVVLRMLVRGARPAHAVVAGQGLDALDGATGRTGGYARVLDALAAGAEPEPGTPDAMLAAGVRQMGGDPVALRLVLAAHVATPEDAVRRVPTPTLVAVGDRDDGHATADALAALLPAGRFARVPGDHGGAVAAPEFTAALLDFLGVSGR